MRSLSIAVVYLICVAACACAQRADLRTEPTGLPDLAWLAARDTSEIQTVDQTGVDAYASSQGATPTGDSLQLAGVAGGYEWAIWSLGVQSATALRSLSLSVDFSGTDEAWIAVGDFYHDRWWMNGPYPSGTQAFDLSSGAPGGSGTVADFVSNSYRVYVAVVVTGPHIAVVDALHISEDVNLPPVPSLTTDHPTGMPGTPVQLDASGSYDPDGSIVQYEWNLDNDQDYELDTGATPQASTTLPDPASSALVHVRVTDNEGRTRTEDLNLRTWSIKTIDAENDEGKYSSLALINGKPAIAYLDSTTSELRFIRSFDTSGTLWLDPPLNVWNQAGYYNSLTTVGGKPAISFCTDAAGGTVQYITALDEDGTTWNNAVDIDTTLGCSYTSLAVVDGQPAIGYLRPSAGSMQVMYSRATDPQGVAWGLPVQAGDGGPLGANPTLFVANGVPSLGYWFSGLGAQFKYTQASDAGGLTWGGGGSNVNVGTVPGYTSSFALVNDNPACASYDPASGLTFQRSGDPGGMTWDTSTLVDNQNTAGRYPSLVNISVPCISYCDTTSHILYFVKAKDEDGSAWYAPDIVDNSAEVGEWACLAKLGTKTAISYYDNTNHALKYAILK